MSVVCQLCKGQVEVKRRKGSLRYDNVIPLWCPACDFYWHQNPELKL